MALHLRLTPPLSTAIAALVNITEILKKDKEASVKSENMRHHLSHLSLTPTITPPCRDFDNVRN